MENSQTKNIEGEASGIMNQHLLTQFGSENGMKTYYLQMSAIIRSTDPHPSVEKEYFILKKLSNRLKQYYCFIQMVGSHQWDKGIGDIQKALGIYLMQSDIDSRERKQTNQEIASLLQFIVSLSGHNHINKQLEGILNHHLSNVERLLTSYPEHSHKCEEGS